MSTTNATSEPQFVTMTPHYWTFANPPGVLAPNLTAYSVIAAFSAVALWLCLDLLVQIYLTFKRHESFYFWSCMVTTIGLLLQTVGFNILQMFSASCPRVLYTLIGIVGWNLNVCGFSLVLYSRLHLVGCSVRTLRLVLAMVITTAILFQIPFTVIAFGLTTSSYKFYVQPREILERIQQLGFTIQEIIISGLYIYNTSSFLRAGHAQRTHNVISSLVITQIFVIGCDAAMTALNFLQLFTLRCIIHTFVYGLKLKIEFMVLNQLRRLVEKGLLTSSASECGGSIGPRLQGRKSDFSEESLSDTRVVSIGSAGSVGLVGSDLTRKDSQTTLAAEDHGGMKLFAGQSMDDLEKQYLGRFGCDGTVAI